MNLDEFEIPFHQRRFFITGINGFIGAYMARYLLKMGAEVYGSIRPYSDLTRISDILPLISTQVLDLLDAKGLIACFESLNPNFVIHTAQPSIYVKDIEKDIPRQMMLTSGMLINLISAAAKIRADKLIHCCSSTIYGYQNQSPFKEHEEPRPDSPRGLIKQNERNILKYHAGKVKLPMALARIFRAYGPGDSTKKLIKRALIAQKNDDYLSLTPAEVMRDYIYVEDIAEGILRMCFTKMPQACELNLGTGIEHSAHEIVNMIVEITRQPINISDKPYPISELDKTDYKADLSKLKRLLNWYPSTALYDGLRSTIDWYRNSQAR